MFTVEQIKEAYSKVKSGSDFPKYVQDLINLGVINYETYVSDSHTDYFERVALKYLLRENMKRLPVLIKAMFLNL